MTQPATGRPIIVGLMPTRFDRVLRAAIDLAEHYDSELICACVDDSQASAETGPVSVDPDAADVNTPSQSATNLAADIERLLTQSASSVLWSLRTPSGDAAGALNQLAADTDAAYIVIGTREPGFASTMREFINGSLATRLTREQHRPVLVVPADSSVPADTETESQS